MLNFVIKQLESLSKIDCTTWIRRELHLKSQFHPNFALHNKWVKEVSFWNKTVVRSEAHSIKTITQGLSMETFPLEKKIKVNPINVD